ncbi:MAG: hypothetical protein NT015_09025 [Alphaproteobacteria bacterium]|nr:hypothetical protein [Alphaproteobacteria bacterium]
MTDLILAAHIIGLMMGAGGGFGSMISQREALKRPADQAAVLRSIGPALANFSMIGLILMWVSGVALVFLKYGGFADLPSMFWIKFVFISTLTLAAIATHVLYGQVKGGNVAAATRLPVFGQIAGMSSLLAVIFAVLAFH